MNAPPCNRKPSAQPDRGAGRVRRRQRAGCCGGGRSRRRSPRRSSSAAAVFVGDWSGRVYAFRKRTGEPYWSTKLHGQVKGAVAVAGRARVRRATTRATCTRSTALAAASSGRRSAQPRFGHAGNFYSTPAVAYGRVYIGATDGKVYSFGASSGKLRWSQSTGGYVYSSPAVWRDRVFAGSYSAALLRVRRRDGRDPLAVHGQRADLRLADRDRGPRLLRDAQRAPPTRSTRGPVRSCGRSRTGSTRRSSPTRAGSTSSATRACTASTRLQATGARTLSAASALRRAAPRRVQAPPRHRHASADDPDRHGSPPRPAERLPHRALRRRPERGSRRGGTA